MKSAPETWAPHCCYQHGIILLFAGSLLLGCGDGIHTAATGTNALPSSTSSPATSAPSAPYPLVITHGGTYTGSWRSDDPNVPAVSVVTDEPVVIQRAHITSRGDLIRVTGDAGANVVIQYVTGTGLDPNVAGSQRGSFVHASAVSALTVKHCTITGTRHGVSVDRSSPKILVIRNNTAFDLEDRATDGAGGFQTARPDLGHFVVLHAVAAVNGADISWNQVLQTMGRSSTEDGINIYKSQGSVTNPIAVHDNYFEGASSPATDAYSGNGVITDGDGSLPVTSFVVFEANQIVHTAGGGVMIADGHDVSARNNRVVSCGKNADGSWYARKQVTAVSVWNFYGAPAFTNNVITSTTGGIVVPDSNGNAVVSDSYINPDDASHSNSVSGNLFTNPCLMGGTINLAAEVGERGLWSAKLNETGNKPGNADQ